VEKIEALLKRVRMPFELGQLVLHILGSASVGVWPFLFRKLSSLFCFCYISSPPN
jgi:hypothetical protein